MVIDDVIIDRIAKLSSLEVDESKRESLKKELGEIVSFVENLNEIDVSHVDATFTTIAGGTPMREDEPFQDKELSQHVLNNAVKSQDGYFIVPKIIE